MAINYEEPLGQILKHKRIQLGMSLRDLGRETGIDYVEIKRIEDGYIKLVDPKKLKPIANALRLDLLFLLSLEGAGVKDKDIRIIARAAGKMNKRQRQQMLKMLRGSFPKIFMNTSSDDLDGRRMAVNYEETMGQIINRKRIELGMSLRELGRVSCVCYAVIARIEEGKIKLAKPEKVTALADALHLDRLFLLSLEDAGVEYYDIRIIARAAGKMDNKQRQQMLKMLRKSFPEAFKNTSSDDLDD